MTTRDEKAPAPAARITFGVLLALSLVLLLALLYPFRQPLFLAAVVAAALAGPHTWLSGRLGGRRHLAAALLLVAVMLVAVVPLSAIATFAVSEAVEGARYMKDALGQGGLDQLLGRLPAPLDQWSARLMQLLPQQLEELSSLAGSGKLAAEALGGALSATSRLALAAVVSLFATHMLLVDGRRLVAWLARVSPLRETQTMELLDEFRTVARSVITSTVAVAGVQAVAATIGYLLGGVAHAAFFGLCTFFTAFVPGVGTALVAVPLAAVLFFSGHPFRALFVLVWGLAVVSVLDNLLKPVLIRGGMHLPAAVIFFSLLGGIVVFGPLGLLAGPLAVTFFVSMTRLGQRDFGGR